MAERQSDESIPTYSLLRMAEEFEKLRIDWLNILAKNPAHSEAPVMILTISAKIEMLDSLLHSAYIFRKINDN